MAHKNSLVSNIENVRVIELYKRNLHSELG